MHSLSRWLAVCIVLATSASLASAEPMLTLSGSLSVGGGADGMLTATGAWNDDSTTLSWVVDNFTTEGLWHYKYILEAPRGGISHIIIQASGPDPGPGFTLENLFDLTSDPMDCIHNLEVKVNTPQQGNPNMPADLYGIKFNVADECDPLILMIEFDSDRGPRWGDFYSKDGTAGGEGVNTVYNSSFGMTIPDDTLVQSGSFTDHLLVPDTGNLAPEPASLSLMALGGLVWTLRRKHK